MNEMIDHKVTEKNINRIKPKFSVVIATHNNLILLQSCLRALYNQSSLESDVEVIVVNDGGQDDISESFRCLKNRLRLRCYGQKHLGPAAARNLGIKKAKGDVILFLDDDSIPTEGWLEAVHQSWMKNPDCDGIGGFIISDKIDSIYCRVNADFFNWYLRLYADHTHHPFLVTCNAGYRKEILNKIEQFDENYKLAAGEDRDLNIKIAKNNGKLKLDDTILIYHDKDLTFSSFIRKNYNYGKGAYHIYDRYPDLERLSKKEYLSLYTSILKLYSSPIEKLMVFFLLTLSQLMTFLGYCSIGLSKKKETGSIKLLISFIKQIK